MNVEFRWADGHTDIADVQWPLRKIWQRYDPKAFLPKDVKKLPEIKTIAFELRETWRGRELIGYWYEETDNHG